MMNPTEEIQRETSSADLPADGPPILVGDAVLNRVRQVARQITERVREVAGDVTPGHAVLPGEPGG
jgi:hypothetical protein